MSGNQNIHNPESFASQFEKTSGLAEWLIWFFVLIAVCAVLSYASIRGELDDGMYIVISLLGGGLILRGFFDARFIDREMKLASKQIKILEEVEDIEEFLDRAPLSVFRSHIDNLYTITIRHSEIRQDNLIEVLHSRLMARNRVVELFASILITLGLIGTIVGLIMMMGSLTTELQSGAGDQDLLQRLADPEKGPLRGLGTAFYTTLLGAVFGGVVLRILTSVVDASIMRYTAHLAELTEVHVLPYLRQLSEELHFGEEEKIEK